MRRTPIFVVVALMSAAAPAVAGPPAETCFGRKPTTVGTQGDDVLVARQRFEVIVGRGGDDVILGRGRGLYACGGRGDDVLVSGTPDPAGWEPAPPSSLRGGAGADSLFGSSGVDTLVGGSGDDALSGGPANDDLVPGPGDDVVDGGAGREKDLVRFGGSRTSVDVDLTAGVAAGEGVDVLVEVESVSGTPFDDRLTGSPGGDTLIGGGGADVLDGMGGSDFLVPDLVATSPWAMVEDAPVADDVLDGGGGNDFLLLAALETPFSVDLATGHATGSGTDMLHSTESAAAASFGNVTLIGNDGPNFLASWHGDDFIDAGRGDDDVYAGEGTDEIDGGDGVDRCRRGEVVRGCEPTHAESGSRDVPLPQVWSRLLRRSGFPLAAKGPCCG